MGKTQWQTMVKTGIPVLALCAMVIALVGCSNKAPVSPFDNEFDGLRAIAYVEEHYTGAPLPGVILDPEADQRYGGLKQEDAGISAETRQAFAAISVSEEGGAIILDFEPEASELVFPPGTVDQIVYVRAKAALYHTPYGPVRQV